MSFCSLHLYLCNDSNELRLVQPNLYSLILKIPCSLPMRILNLLCVLMHIFISPLKADAVYEVTATSLSSPTAGTGSYETIITDTIIDNYQEIFLKDALTYAPSIILNSSGTPGRLTDFSIRGARSSQNLVLVDGIYLNNPATGGNVDLTDYLNADLQQVEVLPGPQNLAYGPGALGGVVQLIPKKGQGKPSLNATAEGGSFRTLYGTTTAQGEEGPLQFSLTAAGFKRGPASFTNRLHGNRQSDHYKNGTFSSRIGYALTDNWEIEGLIRYINGKVQFDEPQSIPEKKVCLPFSSKNFTHIQTLLASFENKWGSETIDHSLKVAYSRFQRSTQMPSDHNATLGEHPVLFYKSEIKLNSQNTLMGGLETGQERARDKQLHKRSHGGIYLIHTFKPFDPTAIKGGIRVDRYQFIGNQITFNIGIDQKLTPTTLFRTSVGTNFKPPFLSDLFQEGLWQVPNPDLKPEKSHSFEIGIDQLFLENKAKVSLTGFLTHIDKITLSRQVAPTKWQRVNGAKRKTRGLEIAISLKLIQNLEFSSAFTLTHARDFPGDKESPLIPTFKGAGGLYWQAQPKLSFFIQGYGVSAQKDSVTKRKLAPYGIIHVGGAYDIIDSISLFGRIENLTNKRYEELFGYGTRGRAFYIGLETKL